MRGRLIGVGVGPGDPELLTVKGIRALLRADTVFVPVGDLGETGRAEAVVRAYVDPGKVGRLQFALAGDAAERQASWDRAGAAVAEVVASGRAAAFATIGDPSVYSTFGYLVATVRGLVGELAVEMVPGVTAMQDLAARSGTTLVEGRERLALLPLAEGTAPLADALETFDTVVCYKGGRHLPRIVDLLEASGRLEHALYGARLGLPGETIQPAAKVGDEPGPYLSTVIALPTRPARGSAP
jgi:precorrin-2/cobalt-factor-2 C20-methyltransferase